MNDIPYLFFALFARQRAAGGELRAEAMAPSYGSGFRLRVAGSLRV
jgi:hypothetical protein